MKKQLCQRYLISPSARPRPKIQNRKYLAIIVLIITIALCSAVAWTQEPTKGVHRIGVLTVDAPATFNARNEALLQGLHELGYVEGKNILIEYRHAEGKLDRLPGLAAELVRLKVDIFIVGGNGAATAAKQTNSTIPIVAGSAGDLVGAGLVASLARPGGNITGSTNIAPDLSGKRLELLRKVVPRASRVAMLRRGAKDQARATVSASRSMGMKVQDVEVEDPKDFNTAYAAMTKQHADAVIIVQGGFSLAYRKQLADLAAKHRLPSMCEQKEWTNDGCLMSYGPDLIHSWRRAAVFMDKILKGAKPANLPVEQPTKFELVVNLKTAKMLGIKIPQEILLQADRVIE